MPKDTGENLSKSVDQLNKFVRDLETRISELKDATQDRSVKKHRQALEKLLTETQKIIKKQGATDRELRDFDRLVSSAEMTADIVEKQHKGDQEFQQEFNKSQKKLLQSLDAVPESIKTLAQTQTAKDVAGTTSAFLTGPFGAILKDVAGDVKQSSDTLLSRLRTSNADDSEPVKGSFAVGTSYVPDNGIFELHKGERVIPQDDNERLSKFLDRMSTSSISGVGAGAGIGADDPVEVTFGRNDTNIEDQFDKVVDGLTRNTIGISRAIFQTGKEIAERIGVIQILMSNIGSNFWGNSIIQQQIWWRRFNRHPILNSFGLFVDNVLPALFLPLTATLKALTGSLFSRKRKSVEEESLRALENIQRLLEGREVGSDVGGLRKFFRSVTDVPGLLFGRGIKQAQNLEARRSRGEQLSEKEIKIIERNIDFITRKAVTAGGSGDGARVIEGEFIKNIDGNVESILDHTKMAFEFDKDQIKRNEKVAKMMLDRASQPNSLDKLFEQLKDTFGKAKSKGSSIFGMLSSLGTTIFNGLKTGIMTAIGALGPLLASAGPWLAMAAKAIGGIGLAFTAGGLVGKYIITPLIETLDEAFKTDILGFIGRMTTEMISWFEDNIPGFKSFFGTEAGGTLNRADTLSATGGPDFIGINTVSPQVRQRIQQSRSEKGLPELLEAVEKQTKILQDKEFNANTPPTPSKGGVEDIDIAVQGQGL